MKKLLALIFLCAYPAYAGTIYVSTGGAATNSGSTDTALPFISAATVTVVGTLIQFPLGTDLSAVVPTMDAVNQSSVYLKDATNSNQKIFWINGVNDLLDTVTVTVAPTGAAVSSATIGGQIIWSQTIIPGALGPSDTVLINDDIASVAGTVMGNLPAGNFSTGFVKFIGKTGTRPKIISTNTSPAVVGADTNWFENLEIIQQGASGAAIISGGNSVFKNMKVSDAGASGLIFYGQDIVIGSEFSGAGADGLWDGGTSANGRIIHSNNIHDNVRDGLRFSANTPGVNQVEYNIFDSNGGRGIYMTTGNSGYFLVLPGLRAFNNTLFGNGDSGMESGAIGAIFTALDNISKDNGNAANEYNFKFASTSVNPIMWGSNNILNISGGLGGGNVYQYTLDSTDKTTDPLFTDAPNGNFSLGSTSPAKAAGYPGVFLGGSTGYLDIGAVQRQEPAGGGGAFNLNLLGD